MHQTYEARARAAASPSMRTVCMLGMMCAVAAHMNGIFAFVGKGYGGNWPNPVPGDPSVKNLPRNSQ